MVISSEGGEAMLRQRAVQHPNVLLDVDSQVDFLTADGRRPVRNLQVVSNIQRVFRWARHCRLTVISSIDFHRITDPVREVPPHCLAGTPGVQKLSCTLLPRRTLVQTDDTINLPHDLLTRYRQVLFLKRGDDLTRNPKADRLPDGHPGCQFHYSGRGPGRVCSHPGAGAAHAAAQCLAGQRCVWLLGCPGCGSGGQAAGCQGGAGADHRRACPDSARHAASAAFDPSAAQTPARR